tara:strand:- start:410 stop:565 length:156 start_codon:yes stop_codon:yes gene_type:complete
MLLLNIIIEEHNAIELFNGARAGIRTRVDGMKTRNDGPGYTTRATAKQPDK